MSTQTHPTDATQKASDTTTSDSNAPGAREKLLADSQKTLPAETPKTTTGQSDTPAKKSADTAEKSTEKAESKTTAPGEKQNEWTVVVDLTATKHIPTSSGPDSEPEITTRGAADKYKKLQELAAESANKPVTFVVQLATHGDPHFLPTGQIVEGDNNPNEPAKLERYRIKDGKIEELAAPKDEGFAKNLENLTRSAIEENPSKKVALMLNADGGGNIGFRGDDGTARLDDVTGALKNALKGTTHDKLDLVDYDCCLMAQDGSLKKNSEIANTVVASAETERVNPQIDGQNTLAQLHALLKDPEMSGADFAKTIVEQARNGSNDKAGAAMGDQTSLFESGTNTLAAFDLTKSAGLSASTDKFGAALDQVCQQSPESKKAIQDIIHSMGSYGDEKMPDADNYQLRDLQMFAQNVVSGIKSGAIKDNIQGDLARSANDVLQNLEHTTIDKFGRNAHDASVPYEKAGDVSAFLPDVGFYDSTKAVHNRLDTMTEAVNKVMKDPELQNNPDSWDATARGVLAGLGAYGRMFKNDGTQSKESQALLNDMRAFRTATTHDDLVRTMTDIQKQLSNIQIKPEFDGALKHEANRIATKHDQYWKLEATNDEPGWNKFVETLRQSSN